MTAESTAATPPAHRDRFGLRVGLPAALVTAAVVGWWWSIRMAADMAGMDSGMGSMSMSDAAMGHSMSFAGFVVAWAAMMVAMMFPAISPVLRLYSLAAARQRVAPLPFFAAAYLIVWGAVAVPAYVAWRHLDAPIADGAAWAGRLAGAVFIAAAIWQLTPVKSMCLNHCRSPLSFFMQYGGGATRRFGAFRMGAAHGLFCLGCCWALMAVLVVLGTMSLVWMAILTGFIFAEKNAPRGERIAAAGAAAFALGGVALLLRPDLLTVII